MLSALDSPDWGLGAILFAVLYTLALAGGRIGRLTQRVDDLEDQMAHQSFALATLVHEQAASAADCPSDQFPAIVIEGPWRNERKGTS